MRPTADGRLGKRLRELRIERGLSQSALAAPNYTHAYVSSIESGRRSPSPRVLQHFAEKLGVDLHELMTGQPADLIETTELELQEARRRLSGGSFESARDGYMSALEQSRRWGLARQEARARHGLALCEERQGKLEAAIDGFEEAEQLAEGRFSDVHADVVAGKARCIEMMGDGSHAIYLLDRTIRDLKRRGVADPLSLLKLYAPLAVTACELGFYTQAAEAAARALALAPEVDDPMTLATTHINVARSLLQQKEHEAALRSLHRAEELFDQLDLQLELGRVHLALGIVLARSQDDGAAVHLRRSLEIFETVGSELDEARTLAELGRVQRIAGRAEARPLLERALVLLRKIDAVSEVAWTHRELGLAIWTSAPDEAEKHLREAIGLYERAESALDVARTYRYIGGLLEATGSDPCDAYRSAALALPLDD